MFIGWWFNGRFLNILEMAHNIQMFELGVWKIFNSTKKRMPRLMFRKMLAVVRFRFKAIECWISTVHVKLATAPISMHVQTSCEASRNANMNCVSTDSNVNKFIINWNVVICNFRVKRLRRPSSVITMVVSTWKITAQINWWAYKKKLVDNVRRICAHFRLAKAINVRLVLTF